MGWYAPAAAAVATSATVASPPCASAAGAHGVRPPFHDRRLGSECPHRFAEPDGTPRRRRTKSLGPQHWHNLSHGRQRRYTSFPSPSLVLGLFINWMLRTRFFMVISMKLFTVSNPLVLLILLPQIMFVSFRNLYMASSKHLEPGTSVLHPSFGLWVLSLQYLIHRCLCTKIAPTLLTCYCMLMTSF